MTDLERKRDTGRTGFPYGITFLDLVACIVAFSITIWLSSAFLEGSFHIAWSGEWTRQVLISAFTTWIAAAFATNPWGDGVRIWIDRLFSAIGFNLMVQYGLDYLFHVSPTPWPVAVCGSVLAIVFISAIPASRAASASGPKTLLLGYDELAEAIRPSLGPGWIGALADTAPASIPHLGSLRQFEEVLASESPSRIVVNDSSWPTVIPPRRLLALRYAGVALEDAPTLFESQFKRVCWEHMDIMGLLLSLRLNINRPAIALQAVYTNIIGLGLLLLASPILILGSLLTVAAVGGFPLETVRCLGCQRMPFQLLRFRRGRRNRKPSWSYVLLKSLRLASLPQLFNVVRGEMALFGPPPVRREFVEPLCRLMPIYAHRFSVKPGILGWSQINLRRCAVPDEALRLQYDLYYIREESPSLDLDILFRTIFRTPLAVAGHTE